MTWTAAEVQEILNRVAWESSPRGFFQRLADAMNEQQKQQSGPAQASGEPLSDAECDQIGAAVFNELYGVRFAKVGEIGVNERALIRAIAAALGPQGGAEPDVHVTSEPLDRETLARVRGWVYGDPPMETGGTGPQALGPGKGGICS